MEGYRRLLLPPGRGEMVDLGRPVKIPDRDLPVQSRKREDRAVGSEADGGSRGPESDRFAATLAEARPPARPRPGTPCPHCSGRCDAPSAQKGSEPVLGRRQTEQLLFGCRGADEVRVRVQLHHEGLAQVVAQIAKPEFLFRHLAKIAGRQVGHGQHRDSDLAQLRQSFRRHVQLARQFRRLGDARPACRSVVR